MPATLYTFRKMIEQSLCILGRQPALGLAELESLFGADKLTPAGEAAIVSLPPEKIPFARLGGTIKLGRIITILPLTNWKEIEKHLVEATVHQASHLPNGKLKIGLSAYGFNLSVRDLNASALSVKKELVKSGRSTRVVPNKDLELSSAQVLYNKLTGELGWELLLFKNGNETILAQTVNVQDIDAYAARDQARPKRDAKVGMLPPKLAQIIINLASPKPARIVQDPFCGTGVLLQEALLMEHEAYGSDIDPRMVEYASANLEWLKKRYDVSFGGPLDMWYDLRVADATNFKLISKHRVPVEFIASETYLGQPYASLPARDQLEKNIMYVNNLHEKFLKNLAKQTKPGFRLCLAVPAWKRSPATKKVINADGTQGAGEQRNEPYMQYGERAAQSATQRSAASNGGVPGFAGQRAGALDEFVHLPVLDHLAELGYNRLSFVHVRNEDLIYHRPGQVVARELLVLKRT